MENPPSLDIRSWSSLVAACAEMALRVERARFALSTHSLSDIWYRKPEGKFTFSVAMAIIGDTDRMKIIYLGIEALEM